MVTIMDTETTSAPRTESISACMTVGTVVISVAHATVLPASLDITIDITESAPVAVETSQDAGITATVEAVTLMDAIMATVEAATSTVIAQGAPHATKVM